MTAWATLSNLEAFLEGGEYADQIPTEAGEAARLLTRASEVIDDHTFGTYERDSLTGAPVSPTHLAALRDATCAQAEQWFEVGEANDIAGYPPETYMTAGVSVNRQPALLAPRAARILRRAGLLSQTAPGAGLSTVELI